MSQEFERLPQNKVEREIQPPDVVELNGQKIELYGVLHRQEVFEAHEDFFGKAIAESDAVIMEGTPEINGYYTTEGQEVLREILSLSGIEITVEEVRKSIEESPDFQFFRSLERLSAKYNRPVISVDPNVMGISNFLQDADGLISLLKMGIVVGGLAPALRDALAYSKSFYKKEEGNVDSSLESKLTRRKFLKILGLGAAGLATGSVFAGGIGGQGRTTPIIGPLAFDVIDYRNVVNAEGMDYLTKRVKFEGNVVAFYGRNHNEPFLHYINQESERHTRLKMYKPIEDLYPPRLRISHYENDKWVQDMEEKFT
ncbi:hypothetical protein KJ785_01710 [Patescibacteria group bacterium]|nr:hypothetical protein [Patescibacteria group bacterium]